MEYIQNLFLIAQNNQIATFLIGILATFVESFIPALPLTGIVVMNAALQGFIKGILSSIIGSVLGTALLYILANKFSHIEYFKKHKNKRLYKITSWVKKQHYIVIYLCYSNPFIPSCLVSIASGFSGIEYTRFIPGMTLGKLTMFILASYIGDDIEGLIKNPAKIVVIVAIIVGSYFLGKVITKKMDSQEEHNEIIEK